jgi:plasmid stabilization system protein ParE
MGKQTKAPKEPYTLRISENALRNFDEITGYIAFINKQPVNALIVGDSIFEIIERIKVHPLAFRECAELPTVTKKYRRAVCKSWQIIYKITGKDILVLGIYHSSRKPSGIKTLRSIK